jgi:hypothetical protein
VEEGVPAQVTLQHGPRRLAPAETRDVGTLNQLSVGPFQGALQTFRLDLDLEDDLAIRDAFCGDFHALWGL